MIRKRSLKDCTLFFVLLLLSGIVIAAGTYQDYLAALIQKESSNDPTAINRVGFLGLYQMGEQSLTEAGYYRSDGTAKNDWRGT